MEIGRWGYDSRDDEVWEGEKWGTERLQSGGVDEGADRVSALCFRLSANAA